MVWIVQTNLYEKCMGMYISALFTFRKMVSEYALPVNIIPDSLLDNVYLSQ